VGDDDGVDASDAPPTPPGPEILDLVAGSEHTCAVLGDRTVKCWGDNREGQLGDGTTTSTQHPVTVTGLSGVATVSVGHEHTCAVLEDGTARCWGKNANGQLGDNTKVDSPTPVTVMGLSGIRSIHAGVSVTCALNLIGQVFCWGRGGELGDGTVTEALTPRRITALTNVSQLSVSSNGGRSTSIHACGVRLNGTAFCWGANDDGQCGNGEQGIATSPVEVSGVTDAVEITAGGGHACLRRTGSLACWGASQLVGDGTVERRFTPVTIGPPDTVVGLFAGDEYTLAQTTDGVLHCWGENGSGQCGDGAEFTPGGPVYLEPITTLTTHLRTVFYDAGGSHACAYNAASMITSCWGSNDFGELGSGEPSSGFRISTPQPVVW
jgi:alpha-tubulin suppressor-like RCC1 family protein